MKKRIAALLMSALMIMSMFSVSYAASGDFSKKLVDSNSWTAIIKVTKSTARTRATVAINYIYKADGSTSNYSGVYAKASKSGTSKKASVGESCKLVIPSEYCKKDQTIQLWCKGLNPALDCKISGSFNVDISAN